MPVFNMSVLDRFDAVVDWSPSRKLVLLGSVGLLATAFATAVNALAYSSSEHRLIDPALINRYMLVWMAAQAVSVILNLPLIKRPDRPRWGAYLYVGVEAPFIAGLMHLFGTMSSPLVAIIPAIVILWTIYFDERIGLFGLAVLMASTLLLGVLETQGLIAYAPVMLNRSMDALNSPVWFGVNLFHILLLLAFCVLLCTLLILSRRMQEERLRAAHSQLAEVNRLISRYLPTQLAKQILSGDYRAEAAPERRRLTIVFSDIVEFTRACENLPGQAVEHVLNRYLSEMVAIADRHGGTVAQIVGDGLMILFGAPVRTSDYDHAVSAVNMSLAMQRRVRELQDLWAEHGWTQPLRIRIGINTGEASVGDFGSAGRKLYSGIGLATNLAERLQSHCEPGEVLMSGSTHDFVQNDIACESRGEIRVKGSSHPLQVYAARPPEPTQPEGERPLRDTDLIVTDPA